MNPLAARHVEIEEGPEDVFLAPLSRARPSGHFAVTPIELIPQGGPRNFARRRRFWHILSFTLVFIIALYLLGAFKRPHKLPVSTHAR